ncbi:hypothetical protein [Brevundimonas vesicularis]|uniref:Uncharacterized protein n=2 Tax=Brevundimonas TaxID=41275 RepID=A0ABU4KNW6_BREVE|nr:hypothetical protein [Brevundimonas vesicularis]MDX2334410.1 hypothetical protein [Brevundimonas vesicularis]
MTAASAPSPGPWPRRTRPDWRKVALATASVAINAGLIATLSLTALGIDAPPSAPDSRPLYIDISPRPLLPNERPRPAMQTPEPVAMSASRDAGSLDVAPTDRVASAPDSRPAPMRPRIAAPTPQGAPAPPGAWTVNPNDRAGAMSRVLRQGLIGCTTPQQLNAAERAHCREDAMRRGMNAAPITGTGNPERDAAFAREGARRLAEWEAGRRPLSGGVGVVGPADCVGSNFGTGCAGAQLNPSLAPDSTRNVQTRRDGHRAGGAPITPGASAPIERWKD